MSWPGGWPKASPGLPQRPTGSRSQLPRRLRSGLGRLDLVTRDEFDAQLKVLERTRARLAALEERLKVLEAK